MFGIIDRMYGMYNLRQGMSWRGASYVQLNE